MITQRRKDAKGLKPELPLCAFARPFFRHSVTPAYSHDAFLLCVILPPARGVLTGRLGSFFLSLVLTLFKSATATGAKSPIGWWRHMEFTRHPTKFVDDPTLRGEVGRVIFPPDMAATTSDFERKPDTMVVTGGEKRPIGRIGDVFETRAAFGKSSRLPCNH